MIDTIYVPGGNRCMTCSHAIDDCSHLMFSNMEKLTEADKNNIVVVKCKKYLKKYVERNITRSER